ncbi:proline iminopeptidase [Rheinheimera pacifica]|uniref:prolyl aminopeptidase n=1 Tax=Rheinheimera pacifica TaxID=173990 RepID=UPI002857F6F1|nr:prolyl aminopeptidase [Rheinheimera pacifica]MDR6984856.1 proline iminopeptidase [Rheinheimera pacifica]
MPYLNVGEGHQLYYELQGDPVAEVPLLFVHGGPGAGVRADDKQLFTKLQRPVIYYDQRGCGKSKFDQRLTANTTEHLIADIELLRHTLTVEQLILVGGSWGSTLSLLYAIRYPQHVVRMVLWGIFLCRQQELDWFYLHGANQLYPEEYQRFIQQVDYASDPVAAYFEQLSNPSRQQQQAAASWARWEAVNSFLTPDEAQIAHFSETDSALPMALLESYYFKQQAFLPPDYILRNSARLQAIPVDIVQGRYDTICPCDAAWQLSNRLAQVQLHISPQAAHDATEPENFRALRMLLLELEPATGT